MITRAYSLIVFFLLAFCPIVNAQITEADLWDIFDDEPTVKNAIHNGDTAYIAQWHTVDSFETNRHTADADSVVKQIYAQATRDKNYPSIIKALIYQLKYAKTKNENNLWHQLKQLDAVIAQIPAPHKNVLQSIAGSAWLVVKKNNTAYDDESIAPDTTDPSTWALKKVLQKAEEYFVASVNNADALQAISVQQYGALLSAPENALRYQPTLYDVLMWRLFTFYQACATNVLNNENAYAADTVFANVEKFVTYNFNPVGYKTKAINTLQTLLKRYLQANLTDALVVADIMRIAFLKTDIPQTIADSLEKNWIETQIERYKNHRIAAQLYYIAATKLSCTNNYINYTAENYNCDNAKALQYCNSAIAFFPNEWATDKCRQLRAEITKTSLSIITEYTCAPKKPFRFFVQYNNVPQLYLRFISISADSLAALKTSSYKYDSQNNYLITQLLKNPVVGQKEITLPNDSSFIQKSVEQYYEGLPQGHYVMIAATRPDFDTDSSAFAYAGFWSSPYALYSTETSTGKYTYFVSDFTHNQPLKGARVVLKYYDYNEEDEDKRNKIVVDAITDKNGTISFEIEDNISVTADIFYKGKKVLSGYSDSYLSYYLKYKGVTNTINTFFYTDRNIYRPGQTLYFKGVCVRQTNAKNARLLENASFTVELEDVNGEVVAQGNYTTNNFGSFSGSFTIPYGGLTGYYNLSTNYGRLDIKVEEYKRPKFEIQFDTLKSNPTFYDTVVITGKAIAFAGNALNGAKLSYTIARTLKYEYDFYDGYYPDDDANNIIATGNTKMNDDGTFTLKFLALPDALTEQDYKYTIKAAVTDITGETQEERTSVVIGKRNVYAQLAVEQEIFAQPKTAINITAKNLNQKYIALHGTISIQQLQTPATIYAENLWQQPDTQIIDEKTYKKLFPQFAYNGENKKENYPLSATVLTQQINDSTGNNTFYWNTEKSPSGYYLISFSYVDNLGVWHTEKEYVALLNPNSKKAFSHKELVVNSAKTTYLPGETAQIIISSRFPKTRLIYFIDQQGVAGKMQQITLNNNTYTLKIPITEADRNGVHVTVFTIYNNRYYQDRLSLQVPHTNKELKIEVATYRDKMLPNNKEEWQLKISGENAKQVSAEVVATMYDASLDKIYASYWGDFAAQYRKNYFYSISPRQHSQSSVWFNYLPLETAPEIEVKNQEMPALYFFDWMTDVLNSQWGGLGALMGNSNVYEGFGNGGGGGGGAGGGRYFGINTKRSERKENFRAKSNMGFLDAQQAEGSFAAADISATTTPRKDFDLGASFSSPSFIKVRRKLDETAFFFPHLHTDDSGNVLVKFIAPEALTQWKFRAYAHTKDLSSGFATLSTITQKPLMVQTNMPRFLRQGDMVYLTAKVVNLSGQPISPQATLEIYDATTGKNIPEFSNANTLQVPQILQGQSQPVQWQFKVPQNYGALKIVIKAYNDAYSDAEANTLPILSNKILVTEALPISFSGKEAQTYQLKKLTQSAPSATLQQHRLTVEFTTNPTWYAIQALPYMMEYPNQCAEQTFNRLYANVVAHHIGNSSPEIKNVFNSWQLQAQQGEGDAFVSNLQKNQELKQLLLQESPWLAEGKTETARKMALGNLFNDNQMAATISATQTQLFAMQNPSGAFPWFAGMPDNIAITQYIVAGTGKLNKLLNKEDAPPEIEKALAYLYKTVLSNYLAAIKNNTQKTLTFEQVQFLYAISFFKESQSGTQEQLAIKAISVLAKNQWQKTTLMQQAMLAIAFYRLNDVAQAQTIIKALKQNAIASPNPANGIYWKQQTDSYAWQDAPIETHSLIIEALSEVAHDTLAVNQARKWLLTQKKLSNWQTTRATADACYALLLNGDNWLQTTPNISLSVGENVIDPTTDAEINAEAGTGYIKKSFSGSEIQPAMGTITITPKQGANIPVAWGAMYWQYFEQLENISYAQTPLSIIKQVFIEEETDSGVLKTLLTADTKLKTGTKLIVRLLLKVNNTMQYVHLKDMRAAALEPADNLSGYQWQNGVGYYVSPRDASINYFFDELPKGQWVFEYPVVVSQAGTFQNGIATVQSMYAPEFSSHSNSIVITVEP